MYLAIDVSTTFGGVGLWEDGVLVRTQTWRSRHNHTTELMPAIDALLTATGARFADLRGIAVAVGPGGFSALRAGLGVAKGFAFATGMPLAGVNTLEATAYPFRGVGLPVCPMIVAGRNLLAWARFQLVDGAWRRRAPDRVGPLEAVMGRRGLSPTLSRQAGEGAVHSSAGPEAGSEEAVLPPAGRGLPRTRSGEGARGRAVLFCGEGAALHAAALQDALGARARVVAEPAPLSRLQGVAELGVARLAAGDADPVAGLRPHYLRPPGITQPRPPRPVRMGTPPRGSRSSV